MDTDEAMKQLVEDLHEINDWIEEAVLAAIEAARTEQEDAS